MTFIVPRPAAIQVLGVSDRTFARLESEGVIVATVKGSGRRPSMFDLEAVVPSYLNHREDLLTGRLETARDRRDRAVAELVGLRVERQRAGLVAVEQVVHEGEAFIAAMVAAIRRIPERLRLAGVVSHAEIPRVVEELQGAEQELGGWARLLDGRAAALEAPKQ